MSNEKGLYKDAKKKLEVLFDELLSHDGFGDLKVEMRLLKRGQKEVIIYCGKQYRYVIDFQVNDKTDFKRSGSTNRHFDSKHTDTELLNFLSNQDAK